MSFITVRTFYRALDDTGRVVENLKERGEGIIYASTIDREIVELASGINAASDTITDYRQNLEQKVEQRTKELSDAKEEVEAANAELEAMNDNLVQVNRELEDANVRYRKDMKMAGNVQNAFLPKKPPSSAEYEVAFVFKPASEVSGDFYDFYIDNGMLTGAGIFDVSGHGISSGLLTLLARSIIFRNFISMKDQKIGAIMNSINRDLIGEIGHSGMYLTGILLRFTEGMVEYANSGHPDMLFWSEKDRRTGKVVAPEGSIIGPFLGVDILEKEFKSIKIRLTPGDCLLLYTDSLIESKNSEGEQYDEKRLTASLKEARGGPAGEMLDHVIKEFFNFMGKENELKDDITAVLIRKK
ncbi:MAG: SpoIIE family protein phosphatase [Spirochaetes bacterium]|nr:SpoIIE family protein phosphatase [Spirochaetota bacterium]